MKNLDRAVLVRSFSRQRDASHLTVLMARTFLVLLVMGTPVWAMAQQGQQSPAPSYQQPGQTPVVIPVPAADGPTSALHASSASAMPQHQPAPYVEPALVVPAGPQAVAPQPTPGQFDGQAPPMAEPGNYGPPAAGVYPPGVPTPTPAAPPASLPPLPPTISGQVPAVVEDYLGMTPEQIQSLRLFLQERQRAAAELPNPPTAVTGSVSVSLTPGSTAPVLRVFQGMVSSLIVVDSTGAPWPVENFRIGNEPLFKVNRLDAEHGSTFTIDTMGMYGHSNLVLKLAGVPTPVILDIKAGQSEVDVRTEVRVQGRGPHARVVAGVVPEGADARLLSVLDGVPPPHGRSLTVDGLAGVRAWVMPDRTLVVRTPVRIISPATTQFVSSADGTHVYTFSATPRLLGIANGDYVNISLKGL